MKWGECIYYLGMSDGGSGGFYCICCGIFRKQTKYITDGDKQNDDSIVQAAATDGTSNGQINAVVDTNAIDYIVERHSPPIGPNCRSDSHHPLNADVKQIQEDNTGNICSPFPNSGRNGITNSSKVFLAKSYVSMDNLLQRFRSTAVSLYCVVGGRGCGSEGLFFGV